MPLLNILYAIMLGLNLTVITYFIIMFFIDEYDKWKKDNEV